MLNITGRVCSNNVDKLSAYLILSTVVLFVVFALTSAMPAYSSVGAIPGEANVQPSGASSYIIPIRVAPGITGFQPELALQYGSGVGDSLLGAGWSLSGLSSIHRCPHTYEQDGEYKGVTLDRSDRLCLDGKRLVAVSGAYGESGTEYRTEIDEYSRIIQSGSCDGSCAFTVETKSGRRYQYGLSENSRYVLSGHTAALLWAVNRIEDTAGNWIDFVYANDLQQNTQLVSRIGYGGTGGLSAGTVDFRYQPKPDPQRQYTHGALIVRDEVLSRIITRAASGKAIRNYQFTYQPSPTNGRTLLSSMQECSGETGQGDCLAPTRLNWYGGYSAYSPWEASSRFPNDLSRCKGITQADANGDGRTDLICAYDTDRSGSTRAITYVQLADDSGYAAWQVWYEGPKTRSFDLERCGLFSAADFNGDGLTDLVCEYNGNAYVQISNGSSYSAWTVWDAGGPSSCLIREVADVNGDGRSDLLCVSGGATTVQISNGVSFSRASWGGGGGPSNTNRCRQRMATDVNGDGLPDALCVYDTSNTGQGNIITYVQLNTGTGYTPWQNWRTSNGSFDLEACDRFAVADFNADGLTDLVCKHGNSYSVQKSTGENFTPWENWGTDSSLGTNTCLNVIATDADGDGRSDLICPQNATGGKTFIKRALTGSNGFSPWESWATSSVPQNNCRRIFLGDTQGNSMPDLICLGNDAVTYTQRYQYSNPDKRFSPAGYTPRDPNLSLFVYLSGDMLKAVDDGVGVPTEFVYSTLVDTRVYSADLGESCSGTGQDYPINCRAGARYVVAETKTDNGIGGVSFTSYFYRGGRAHMLGRGFLGFTNVEITDQTSSIATITTYDQDFAQNGGTPRYFYAATGLPNIIVTEKRNGDTVTPLKRVENFHNYHETAASGSGFLMTLHQTATSEITYETSGRPVKRMVTLYDSYDDFGNPQQINTGVEDHTGAIFGEADEHTENEYYNDTGQWILGRLLRSTVTKDNRVESGSVRQSSFEYDPGTGFLTAETIEPGNPELELRTEYQYDVYGNRISSAVSDSGAASYPITARTSTTGYDYSSLSADSTYRITSTNAKGHTEAKIIDARFGVTQSLTGPNGLTTSWRYDDFGVKQVENRADGTTTRWDRVWCRDTICPDKAIYSSITTTPGSASQISYVDSLERSLRAETVGLNGRKIVKDTQYDEQGRVAAESRNYFEGDTPCGGPCWTTFQYDILDRVTRVNSPDGGIIENTYDGLVTTERRYDSAGTYDQTSSIKVNVLGQVISVTDAAGQQLTQWYDAEGNLIYTTDPAGNSTSLWYDTTGRKIAMTDPDMGTWLYWYDALGQLRDQLDAKKQLVTTDYDVLGRMVSRTEAEGVTRWTYDTEPRGVGKLAVVIAPGFHQLQSYDTFGRPSNETRSLDGVHLYSSLNYDDLGRVARLSYPGGLQVAYAYNVNGYLTQVSNSADSGEVFWRAEEADADGNVVLSTLGNGLQTVRLYDPFSGNLKSISTGLGRGSDVQFLTYGFDGLGNLTQRIDENQSLTEDFRYDAQNRLIESSLAGAGSQQFAYDSLGNITQKGVYSDYRYGESGAGPHAVSFARGQTYSYDANGNMTAGAGRSLTWSSYNKPGRIAAGATDVQFDYGPDRARFRQIKSRSGQITTTLYYGKLYEQITRNGETEQKYYIQAGGQTVAVHTSQPDGTEVTRYLHQDHLGSTDVITDEKGGIVKRTSFSAFGSYRNLDWSTTPIIPTVVAANVTTRGFTGHEQLDNVGLVHMNGRVYDPALGRFLSADPNVQFANNLQNYNRYSYVNNNPLSYTDPSGFFIHKKIKNAFKKAFSNKWVRLAASIAIGAATGFTVSAFLRGLFIPGGLVTGAAAGGAAAGFAGGIVVTGGDVNASLKLGAAGALTAGTFQGFSGSGFLTRVAGNGIAGGTSSKFLGGSFRKGAVLAALTVSASELVTRVNRGVRPTFRTAKGEAVGKPIDGLFDCNKINCDVVNSGVPNAGNALFVRNREFVGVAASRIPREALVNPPGFFNSENGLLSVFAKVIPGFNSGAVFHDNSLGQLARSVSPIFSSKVSLAATIPPFFAVEVVALGVPQIVGNVKDAESE